MAIMTKHEMKSVLLRGQIMFYSLIFNSQAQLDKRDIQKFDFEKVVFTSKKPKFMIFDMLPERPIIPYCAKEICNVAGEIYTQ